MGLSVLRVLLCLILLAPPAHAVRIKTAPSAAAGVAAGIGSIGFSLSLPHLLTPNVQLLGRLPAAVSPTLSHVSVLPSVSAMSAIGSAAHKANAANITV